MMNVKDRNKLLNYIMREKQCRRMDVEKISEKEWLRHFMGEKEKLRNGEIMGEGEQE